MFDFKDYQTTIVVDDSDEELAVVGEFLAPEQPQAGSMSTNSPKIQALNHVGTWSPNTMPVDKIRLLGHHA